MDGGVDLAIARFFGAGAQDRVQAHILAHYTEEQPVGTSFIVGTVHSLHRYVAHTPTVRVTMTIPVTDHVKALLEALAHFYAPQERIRVVVCPGLGTAMGRVPVEEVARQMALAYEYHLGPPRTIAWPYATNRGRSMISGEE